MRLAISGTAELVAGASLASAGKLGAAAAMAVLSVFNLGAWFMGRRWGVPTAGTDHGGRAAKTWQAAYTVCFGIAVLGAGAYGFIWLTRHDVDVWTDIVVAALSVFGCLMGITSLTGVVIVAARSPQARSARR